MKFIIQVRRSALRCALLLTAFTSVASAQNQTWIRQLGSSAYDSASAVTPDGAGGVFLCGNTFGGLFGSNNGGGDAWLARYDAAGNRTWIWQFGSSVYDSATAVAPDGVGGVYVCGNTQGSLAGTSQDDAWLARYDGSGNRIWIRQFGSGLVDRPTALAADGTFGVYVAGSTNGDLGGPNAGGTDAWLTYFNSQSVRLGTVQWGSTQDDIVLGAAPDGARGVYLSGSTDGSLSGTNSGASDAWCARYVSASAGGQSWIRQLGTTRDDEANGAASDGTGGVYVTGRTGGNLGGSIGGNFDAWVARYDGAGNQTWIRQLGTDDTDFAWAAASDGSGGVYVTGQTNGSLGAPNAGSLDAWLVRYDGAGHVTLIQQLGTSNTDYPYGVAADGAGGAYVCGNTSGSLGGPHVGNLDGWLARYDGGIAYTRYCTPAIPNSTGQAGRLNATGNNSVAVNDVTLEASQLPLNSFGYLLTSRDQGDTYPVSFSQGRLCLGGFIGRYVGPAQVANSGATGSFSLAIDLASMPQPLGNVAARPGETWNFQAWHRDANPMVTSNFTDAIAVMFL